jgi:hypothetical protein
MKQNDWFFDQFTGEDMMDDFDKTFKTMSRVMIGFWVFAALFNVAVLVTVVWLLLHFFG